MPSRPHRRSFMRTTILASCTAAALLILLGMVCYLPHLNTAHHLLPAWGVWLAVTVVAAGLAAASALTSLVAVGGVVVLHRDTCEERGLPYFPVRARERITGPVRWAWRRFLNPRADLRPGEFVEVRSLPEILATLDKRGCLEGLPFMPEMVVYCGHRFQVQRRVDKVYEYAHGTGLRRMRDAVLLATLRCNGQSHGGCQAGCQFIWKEAWLKRPETQRTQLSGAQHQIDLHAHTHATVEGQLRYVCQITEFIRASTPMHSWDARHYVRDLARGNVRLIPFLIGIGVKLFNWVQWKLGGATWAVIRPVDEKSPSHQGPDLQQGDIVRVKPKHAIEATLNHKLRNRGLQFDRTMLAYCGGSYRVAGRVDRMVHEATGELVTFKTPGIRLEGVTFIGESYFESLNDFVFWREVWLEPPSCPTGSAREL